MSAPATIEVVEVTGADPVPGAALTAKGQVLLSRPDLLDPQVWYDEDTLPLHAHVVVDIAPAARARYEAFTKARPKAHIATVVNGVVENVSQIGTLGIGGRFFITLRVPAGAQSNAPVASALCVALGGKPRTD